MKKLDRIAAYGRYLVLLEGQDDALQAGDLARFGALAEQRDELAAAIDAAPPVAAAEPARALLGRCLELDTRMRARLNALRDEARNRLHDTEMRRPRLTPYLAAQGAPGRIDRVS